MTVTVIGTLTARPERREDLHSILAAMVAPTRTEPGCINYDFHVDATDPCVFVFYENWRSEADHAAHMKTPHLAPLLAAVDSLLAKPVDVRRLSMLSALA
ncbi:antibiotic biosynthesis monooxygenase [Mesorhizobium sp. BR1-1-16]|uniref:putative quinol monooxygenase n=1 Tax=Mesorhizobium sp. BR1-1-16 TaxID=2876653 RepID=UPI001CCFC47E|nr:putative quinol monooxygenase [Mesorhizobium sp. BR1-1-16]MBZ9938967.1 antibiotic biosynthesis monooxygenase [Mesorhizobium sp. BR1-1-16]